MIGSYATSIVLLTILLTTLIPPAGVQAQSLDNTGPSLEITEYESSVLVRWQTTKRVSQAGLSTYLPTERHGNYELPMQLVTVVAGGELRPAAQLGQVQSEPWNGILQLAQAQQPPALNWGPMLAPLLVQDVELPTSPFFVLRQGTMRGRHVVVFAFSPIYKDPFSNDLRLATGMNAAIPGVRLLTTDELLDSFAQSSEAGFSSPLFADALSAPEPVNPMAKREAVKVFVEKAGIQRIRITSLADVGIPNADVNRLHLYHDNIEIPLHLLDRDGNGTPTLDLKDEIRFYAPGPSDRWNRSDVYWLVVDDGDSVRMDTREAESGQAAVRTTALERGVWAANKEYNSNMAGADGDHWFHLDAWVDSSMRGDSAGQPTFRADLNPRLPLAPVTDEPSVFTLTGTAHDPRRRDPDSGIIDPSRVPHEIRLRLGATERIHTWNVDFSTQPIQNWTEVISTTVRTDELDVSLVASQYSNDVLFDKIYWQQPAILDFQNKGATFSGVPGVWRYRLTDLPPSAVLYDVTDPSSPVVLHTEEQVVERTSLYLPDIRTTTTGVQRGVQAMRSREGAAFTFQDGPDARDYIVAGEGTLHTPKLSAHSPVNLTAGGADAVYIAPAQFHTALQPLVAHRISQGYEVQTVDVQAIYDSWSFGRVEPTAIRDFLRYAVANWSPAPVSVVLVGDGTRDPLAYLEYDSPTWIPPYLADVDPWLGETACENCYAQLDGDDPLTEGAFLIDIWLGRFPVATVEELRIVVGKIVDYETADDLLSPWRRTFVQLADDYIHPDGSKDPAGNFTRSTERVVSLQPELTNTLRNYYNAPFDAGQLDPGTREWMDSIEPWIESDSKSALQKTIDLMNGGAGIVTFTGHSHHWKWATTDPSASDGRLFGLWDVLELTNRDNLFIGLSMTCYTSQFEIPAEFHFTLDEHLFLHPDGGAVAVWGPAGLSVAHGHDTLQTGFYRALWQEEPMRAPMGRLVQAGYAEIVTRGSCCQDVTRTFLLLGDPLTPARVRPFGTAFLPFAGYQAPTYADD